MSPEADTTNDLRPLPSGRDRRRFVNLAAIVTLVFGVAAIATGRLVYGGGGSNGAIEWRSASQVPISFTFGLHLASTDSGLFLAGNNMTAQVWTSANGATWARASAPGVFGGDFVARGLSSDGAAGVVLVGQHQPAATPAIWRASDGLTFAEAQIDGPTSAEVVSVAAQRGHVVAFGDHTDVGTDGPIGGSLDVWSSTSGGASWRHNVLPESSGYAAKAITTWNDGFAAVAFAGPGSSGAAVWTSVDGTVWQKSPVPLDAMAVTTVVALADKLVVLGGAKDPDSDYGMVPASWTSTDGREWTESTAPVRNPDVQFTAATVVGSWILAIGTSVVAEAGVGGQPEVTFPPAGPESVWLSQDGSSWRLLPADPSLAQLAPELSCVGAFEGQAVIATSTPGDPTVRIFMGRITS